MEKWQIVIQSFVFPGDVCSEPELFYRNEAEGNICDSKDSSLLELDKGAVLSSDAYMNFFDKTAWRRYTSLTTVDLTVRLKGKGVVELYDNDILVKKFPFQFVDLSEVCFPLDMQVDGICYFKIRAEEKTVLYQAAYKTNRLDRLSKDVKLAVLICTYKREKLVTENLQRLGNSLFFEKGSDYYGNLFLYVTDNASTLQREDIVRESSVPQIMADYICLKQSENLGGSGGFTNCILEMRKNYDCFPATHAIFLDDDILFIPETFYRLYALLSYIKPEFDSEVIAGRMFRMDQRNIQYTASEVWNKGNLIHKGFQEDMSKRESLNACNEERGEYAGWWFAVYPYSFVEKNLPLPFFMHCDDVEYGLRHKGCPIVLNGIQVWHETYEYRGSPVIDYYDLRNSMTVNAIYGFLPDKESFLTEWKEQITEQHLAENYLEEHMLILAMRDFLKGKRYFMRRDIQKEFVKRSEAVEKQRIKFTNSILWRLAAQRIRAFYKSIVRGFQE